ncbi:MAG TPA: GNAT family N-acetyltransferase [Rhodanobacteraceae bacterium]|jgi:predicted N-acyltransferase
MEAIIARSIEAFDREEWNALFADELEDWFYYRAVENAGLPGFEWIYLAVWEHGRLRAAVPGFVTDYRIDTTLSGPLARLAGAIARVAPRLLRIPLVSLGSPVGEICHLGFAPDCGVKERRRLAGILLGKLVEFAMQRRIGMIAVKDANGADDDLWAHACGNAGLRRMPGQATAVLDLPFRTLDAYLASLGPATRKDMRRKLRTRAAIRVEWRREIDDVIDRIMALYKATLAHAEFRFEELTPAYFRGVMRDPRGRALCATYWLGEQLIGFNLVLHNRRSLLDKFFGMDDALGRAHNLYYLSWIENVRYCIDHGLVRYQSGQGLEREKLRLGSRLAPNWLWYRHRNRVVDRVFATVEHVFRLDGAARDATLPPAVSA